MATMTHALELNDLKSRLRATWMAGDYDLFSRYMERGARVFFERIPLAPGSRWLDVGCGSGQVALMAARSGLTVTGIDIAGNLIECARRRAAAERLNVRFEEADAEAIPFPDGSFDVVVSNIAAMFAPRPDLVAGELLRVCRSRGVIAMANWTARGFVGQMFKTIARFIAPLGMPSPLLWGEEDIVQERLGKGLSELRLARRLHPFEYPFGPAEVVELFRKYYGPTHCAFASLANEDQRALRQQLETHWSAHNQAGPNATQVDAEYLEVFGIRS
jgi:SAM-dependent methyltransferase